MLPAQTQSEWMSRGVQAFRSAKYGEAVVAFEHVVAADPGNVTAHLYLGTAHLQQYIPGAEASENIAHADRAAEEFDRVLAMEPGDKVALASMASLQLNRKRYEDARAWNKRLLVIDPSNKTAYYSIAFSIWSEWYPAYSAARQSAGLTPEMPGPIPDPAVRESLRARWWAAIDEAIFNLKRAVDLDPDYSDAMAYVNLFIRERADLVSSQQEYTQEISEADRWVGRALEAKKKEAANRQVGIAAPPPPPPPPPNGGQSPKQIRVGGNVQASKLVNKVDPVYPDLARRAGIQGAVEFSVVIGRDGNIAQIQVESGHPLLVPAAIEALKQWRYQPTLLNGDAVEVQTEVEVTFALQK
jgi:TonB family protein